MFSCMRPLRFCLASLGLMCTWLYILSTPITDSFEGDAQIHSQTANAEDATWQFDVDRDRNHHSLDAAQCSNAFPRLYEEIDRAALFWSQQNGEYGITPEHLDLAWSYDGGLRCMIINQQLFIVYSRGLNHFQHWRERSHATLLQIQRAIDTAPYPIPDIEFAIKINDDVGLTVDSPLRAFWAYSRNITDAAQEQIWIIPDFNFWAYPRVASSFSHFQIQALEMNDFDAKVPELIWRGTTHFNPTVREALIEQTRGKPWANVHNVSEDSANSEAIRYRIALSDHCQFKFAAHTEGTTWSGRLKYLLSCHSVVLIHTLSWTTHLYHLLVDSGPNQNYQWIEDGWRNLDIVMQDLIADTDKSRTIADNAAATFRDRYMTPAAETCYWRRLFTVWAELSFQPDPYSYEELDDGTVLKTWRGLALEEYIFHDQDLLE